MSCQLTVLMAVYNGSPYLKTAVDSILQQTYSDFHFVIVDDASTDDTVDILRSYQDERIHLHCLKDNVGQTAALNIGLRRADTKWIARMDADDYSAPTRLEQQMLALEADPLLSCLGTYAWIFRHDPQVIEGSVHTQLQHDRITWALLKGSPLIHGSIVVDREALLGVGGYEDRYRYSADMEMYDRLLLNHRAGAIPQPLLGIRRHEEQGSRTTVAFDENIEIFSNRLLQNGYSTEETAIIRTSLSRFYLYRAMRLAGQLKIFGFLKDLVDSVKTSPKTFLPNIFKVFLVALVPEKSRSSLKRILTGVRGS